MGNNISRRTLLRNGAFLAGAIPFAGSLLNKVQAAPIASGSLTGHAASAFSTEGWTEREIGLSAVEPLKARLYANENPFGPSDKDRKSVV